MDKDDFKYARRVLSRADSNPIICSEDCILCYQQELNAFRRAAHNLAVKILMEEEEY